MKRLLTFALATAMALSLTACGGDTTGGSASSGGNTSVSSSAGGSNTGASLPEITAGSCQTPAILTSIGQSADVDIVSTLCNKAGLEVETNATLSADDLTADCKTLILAVGGSSKGLGAAGIDENQELERTNALLSKAEELGVTVLAMHTGGSARRGTLSDTFIKPAFEAADIAIVVSEGDSDGLMSGILAQNNTPSAYVAQAADCLATLQTLFGL